MENKPPLLGPEFEKQTPYDFFEYVKALYTYTKKGTRKNPVTGAVVVKPLKETRKRPAALGTFKLQHKTWLVTLTYDTTKIIAASSVARIAKELEASEADVREFLTKKKFLIDENFK